MEIQSTNIKDTFGIMSKKYDITVFTATYNRAHTLPRLYDSLVCQNLSPNYKFEWLIIDDGSTDNTECLVKSWIEQSIIPILYIKTANGGKPRAINKAVNIAHSDYLFIIDSDDYVADESTIEFLIEECKKIETDCSFVGIGGLQGINKYISRKKTLFDKYIDATNLQRVDYGLDVDCNEVYKIEILKKYPFNVWNGETFVPEEVVLNELALDGYKIRWFNRIIVISEYLDGGLTKGAWQLIKKNPMGYAMLYEHKLKQDKGLRKKLYNTVQMIAQSILGHNPTFPFRGEHKIFSILCYPLGALLAIRRIYQFKRL